MPSSLFHPDLLAELAGFFPDACAIEQPVYVTDPGGEKRVSGYVPLPGHEALRCAVGLPSGGEQQMREANPIITGRRIALAGYYPAVTRVMRAVVGGQAYDILAVDHDQHRQQTYLGCEVAEP